MVNDEKELVVKIDTTEKMKKIKEITEMYEVNKMIIDSNNYLDVSLMEKYPPDKEHVCERVKLFFDPDDGYYDLVDINIAPLIYEMWKVKCEPEYSCEDQCPEINDNCYKGHYIRMSFRNKKKYYKFLEIVFYGVKINSDLFRRSCSQIVNKYKEKWYYDIQVAFGAHIKNGITKIGMHYAIFFQCVIINLFWKDFIITMKILNKF